MPSNLRVGDHMYEDVNKDGKLTQDDLVFLGTDDPKVTFAFDLGLEWRGFDVSAIFQGAAQRTVCRDADSWKVPFKAVWMNTSNHTIGKVWSPKTLMADTLPIQLNQKSITGIICLLHGL